MLCVAFISNSHQKPIRWHWEWEKKNVCFSFFSYGNLCRGLKIVYFFFVDVKMSFFEIDKRCSVLNTLSLSSSVWSSYIVNNNDGRWLACPVVMYSCLCLFFLTVCSLGMLMYVVKEVEMFEDEIQGVFGCSFVLTRREAPSYIKSYKKPKYLFVEKRYLNLNTSSFDGQHVWIIACIIGCEVFNMVYIKPM